MYRTISDDGSTNRRDELARLLKDEFKVKGMPHTDDGWAGAADEVIEALHEADLFVVYGSRLRT